MTNPLNEWAHAWARKVGIYGIKTEEFDAGHHDDLDAFRHAFCHGVLVSYSNLSLLQPNAFVVWLANSGATKLVSDFIGWLMEQRFVGRTSASPCPKAMDIHNNNVGRDLAFSQVEMMQLLWAGTNPLEALAGRIADAVKNETTINRLDDPRMPIKCFKQAKLQTSEYIWQTAGDDKVRFDHAVREGKVFQLSNPPKGGHPGSAYNCRCVAVPLVTREKIK